MALATASAAYAQAGDTIHQLDALLQLADAQQALARSCNASPLCTSRNPRPNDSAIRPVAPP
ncbi:MAG: hypothetical protein R3F44_09640 [Candidatus Competibacteraceae bacterium]